MTARVWRNMDWFLAVLTVVAAILGLAVVAGVSGPQFSDAAVQYYLKRQAMWVVLGCAAFVLFAHIDYHDFLPWRRWLYVLMVGLLATVFVIGHHANGAERAIDFGPFQLQPSEPAKLLLVVTLGAMLESRLGQLRRVRDLIVPVLFTILPVLLVVAQPDLGSSLVLLAILLVMVFAAGFPGGKLLVLVILGVGLAVAAVVAHLRWHVPIPLHTYQLNRLTAFINPKAQALTNGWQVLQSEMAIGSGRLHGTGLFSSGVSNQLGLLNEKTTDFVFSSLANMLGFYGGVLAILLEVAIAFRATQYMARAKDAYGGLLAAGVAAMIGFQAFLNIGMTLGILPVTGVPLPFMSYGGSGTVIDFAAAGLLESIYVRRKVISF